MISKYFKILIKVIIILFFTNIAANANTSNYNVKKLSDAYCNCTGSIEIQAYFCPSPVITYGNYKLFVNPKGIAPPNGNVMEQGTFQNGSYYKLIEGLCPGEYVIYLVVESMLFGDPGTIMETYVAYGDIIIEGPENLLNVTVNATSGECEGSGVATINISGGYPPYKIIDCNTSKVYSQTSNTTITMENLNDGSYCYKIIDAKGCERDINFQIPEQVHISAQWETSGIDCDGAPNSGFIRVTNKNPSDALACLYDENGNSLGCDGDEWLNLTEGRYKLTVSSGNCIKEYEIPITITPLPPTNYVKKDAGCDRGLGSIEFPDANAYYKWDDMSTPCNCNERHNLQPGTYKVKIYYNIKCFVEVEITIEEMEPFWADYDISKKSGCSPSEKGKAIIQIRGGTPPYILKDCNGNIIYDYELKYNSTENYWYYELNNLDAGHYCYEVFDGGNCGSKKIEFDMGSVESLRFAMSLQDFKDENGNCYSKCTIPSSSIKGKAPYTVIWDDGTPSSWNGNPPEPFNIKYGFPATHKVKIIDANGCELETTAINPSCDIGGIISLYSNPTNQILNVEHLVLGRCDVQTVFYDQFGFEVKRVDHGFLNAGQQTLVIDVSQLPVGVYSLHGEYNGYNFGESILLIKTY